MFASRLVFYLFLQILEKIRSPETNPRRAHSDLPISSFLRHSSFELRHFYQAAFCNSVYSHALAKTQSRRTVTVEIFRTSAISS